MEAERVGGLVRTPRGFFVVFLDMCAYRWLCFFHARVCFLSSVNAWLSLEIYRRCDNIVPFPPPPLLLGRAASCAAQPWTPRHATPPRRRCQRRRRLGISLGAGEGCAEWVGAGDAEQEGPRLRPTPEKLVVFRR